MEYFISRCLRVALCRFHVTNRFMTLSVLEINSFSTVTNLLGFKMLVPFKVFICHDRKPNGSNNVLTFRLFVVLPASYFAILIAMQIYIIQCAPNSNSLEVKFSTLKFYANCLTTGWCEFGFLH